VVDKIEELNPNRRDTLMAEFREKALSLDTPRILIIAVKLPTGAIEVITNTQELESKIDYYMSAYDWDFKLKANPDIEVVNFMLI
jgi:hypothetical protein